MKGNVPRLQAPPQAKQLPHKCILSVRMDCKSNGVPFMIYVYEIEEKNCIKLF